MILISLYKFFIDLSGLDIRVRDSSSKDLSEFIYFRIGRRLEWRLLSYKRRKVIMKKSLEVCRKCGEFIRMICDPIHVMGCNKYDEGMDNQENYEKQDIPKGCRKYGKIDKKKE